MPTDDPKQDLIDFLLDTDPAGRREQRGLLAEKETIRFLKEKRVPDLRAYVLSYTSTTKQKWFEARLVMMKTVDDLTMPGFHADSIGITTKAEKQFSTTEEDRVKYGSQPWLKLSTTEQDGYCLLYGRVIANGHHVTTVRMIPSSGQVEEDEVHEGIVLFLSQCSLPIEFEFYDSSRTLLGKQHWNGYLPV